MGRSYNATPGPSGAALVLMRCVLPRSKAEAEVLKRQQPWAGGRDSRKARHGWRAPEWGQDAPTEGKANPGQPNAASRRSLHSPQARVRAENIAPIGRSYEGTATIGRANGISW